MKKILLTSEKPYFKANLHCHSTVSDGRKTPEELKKMYMEKGYSIIAYTDHNVLVPHKELNDDKFLALNGVELDVTRAPWGPTAQTCHMCFIALDPNNLTQICYHREKYIWGNATEYRKDLVIDESKPDFEREYCPEVINKMIAEGVNNGFFVTYNHPSWSNETLNEYGKYHGMNAMEICNYGCVEAGFCDYNEKEYDEMLRGGERIFCVSTDDNHNGRNDSFGGFTVINADKLEYKTITDALSAGNFYASQGPAIKNLWYEDGKIYVECSDAFSIIFNTGVRNCEAYRAKDAASPLTSACFNVGPDVGYVRVTVTDFAGNHANSNAYFVDELNK